MSIVFSAKRLSARDRRRHDEAVARGESYLESESRVLESVMDVDRTRFYEKFALGSTKEYCVAYMKLSENVAYNFIAVARKAREVPELKAAIDARRLGVSKARKIVSVLTPQNQEEWIAKAIDLPLWELEREVAERSGEGPPDRVRPVKGGRVRVEIVVTAEEFAELRRAQDLVSASERRDVTIKEALLRASRFWTERRDPARKAERARRSSRDERKSATIPAWALHAVHRRDQGRCQATGADGAKCGRARYVHVHHLKQRCEGGGDDPSNLTTLCSQCHRRWHRFQDGLFDKRSAPERNSALSG